LKAFAVFCGATLEAGKVTDKDTTLANDVAFYKDILVSQDDLHILRTFNFDVHSITSEPTTADLLIPFLFHMFESLNLLEKFNIPHTVLYQFLITVRGKYHSNVQYPLFTPKILTDQQEIEKWFTNHYLTYVRYHNFTHAFDVTQTLYAYICTGDLREMMEDLDVFVLLISGLCHDMDHMGVNNAFHSKVNFFSFEFNLAKPLFFFFLSFFFLFFFCFCFKILF
jgi:3'5'-cyclic nucleotide phosphodiesterase